MENRNLIIAFILILGVWFGSSLLFPAKPVPQADRGSAEVQTSGEKAETSFSEKNVSDDRELKQTTLPLPESAAALESRELVVETDLFTAVFTNSGGRLKSLTLKDYRQTPKKDSPLVSLVSVKDDHLATLRTSGLGDFGFSSETLFSMATQEDLLVLGPGEQKEIVFSTQADSGLRVDKVFTVYGDRYDFDLQVRVTNTSSQPRRGSLSLALVQPWDDSMDKSRYSFTGPAVFEDEKVHTYKVEDIEEQAVEHGEGAGWTAFEKEYFMAAAVPLTGAGENYRLAKVGQAVENSIVSDVRIVNPGEQTAFEFLLYYGPRDLEILKKVGHSLEEAIDFGFFGVIARPLLSVLKFFYQYVGNYGVAIILLTFIIKLLFWPLTRKSYQSMKSMQTLQPEMQKIREKHKNDKEKMNKEIMELYKTKRVNPMGGCLPMFIQIPVFFALYKVLLGTIELRHAPFVFWIQDLAAKDPYYITPLIMGATMFIQQKMSPSTMDPAQAKIFMFMPIIFTFMFLNFPSGLVLYWLVNNLLTILQQWFINRESKPATA
ncbi:MAG: membrane protein insertase YidC [Syntrophotaleaceae bacterium]